MARSRLGLREACRQSRPGRGCFSIRADAINFFGAADGGPTCAHVETSTKPAATQALRARIDREQHDVDPSARSTSRALPPGLAASTTWHRLFLASYSALLSGPHQVEFPSWHMLTDPMTTHLTTILAMAESLGLKTTAAGVRGGAGPALLAPAATRQGHHFGFPSAGFFFRRIGFCLPQR